MSKSYLPEKEMVALCPFANDGACRPNCMMLLTYADKETVEGPTNHGEGVCAIAAAASHIASKTHYEANLLMKVIKF